MLSNSRKWLIAMIPAALLTISLLAVMQFLVSPHDINFRSDSHSQKLHYVRLEQQRSPQEIRTTPPPPEIQQPPPPPKLPKPVTAEIEMAVPARIETETFTLPQFDIPQLALPAPAAKAAPPQNVQVAPKTMDTHVTPLVKFPPIYPRTALSKGLEGWVKVGITISKTGTVADAKVLDAKPKRIFDRAAIRAIYRWKFKPQIVDGAAVENYSTQVIHFQLEK